jgi:ATPase family AAA domain-containing protein 3A/B
MNKFNAFLVYFLVFSVTGLPAQTTKPIDSFNIQVAGFNATPEGIAKMLAQTAQVAHDLAKKNRDTLVKKRANLYNEQQELGKRKDNGTIGQAEFEQSNKVIDAKIVRINQVIDHENQRGEKIGDGIQTMVMQGFGAYLEDQKQANERKTQVAVAAAAAKVSKEAENVGALQRLQFLTTTENLQKTGAFIAATSLSVIAGYYGVNLLHKYLESKMGLPNLIQASSIKSWREDLSNYVNQTIFGVQPPAVTLDELILNEQTDAQLKTLAESTKAMHELGLPYQRLLMYGRPGTGKTMYAKLAAQYSGMEWAYLSGADFTQFDQGADVTELHKTFDWAEQSKKGLVLIIDEADAFLRKRSMLDDRGLKLLDAFLTRTSTSSKKIMLIFATNHPELLDPAALSRIDKKIKIELPGEQERFKMINMYLGKYINKEEKDLEIDGVKLHVKLACDSTINDTLIQEAAAKTEGLCGREIEQMVSEMRQVCYVSKSYQLSQNMFNKLLEAKIAQHKNELNGFAADIVN